jgi:hypothetical protein
MDALNASLSAAQADPAAVKRSSARLADHRRDWRRLPSVCHTKYREQDPVTNAYRVIPVPLSPEKIMQALIRVTRVAPDGRRCDPERPLVNAGRQADGETAMDCGFKDIPGF